MLNFPCRALRPEEFKQCHDVGIRLFSARTRRAPYVNPVVFFSLLEVRQGNVLHEVIMLLLAQKVRMIRRKPVEQTNHLRAGSVSKKHINKCREAVKAALLY
jgi:hypothetical protein